MTFGAFLSLTTLAALMAVLPVWPWSRGWDYRPAILLAVFLTFVILLWVGLII